MEEISFEHMNYEECLTRFEELQTFYEYKHEQDKKEAPSKTERWGVIQRMCDVVKKLASAKLEERLPCVPLGELHVARHACSMLLNFSYACDLMSRGFVTFGRCEKRERRFYEYPLENAIELIEEEIDRVASLNQEAHQKLQQNG